MVKTLFTEIPTYSQITAFRLEYHNLIHLPKAKIEIWKKCRACTINLPKGALVSQKDKVVDPGNTAASKIPID